MSEKFRLGIVGCGKIARRHAAACLSSSRAELKALVDNAPSRREQLAESLGVKVLLADQIGEIVDSVDGVIIAAPNHIHHQLVMECLQAELPALVEKPMGVSVEEAEEICRESRRTGVTIAVGYCSRFQDSAALLRRVLRSNRFGRLIRFAHQEGANGGWSPYSAYNLDQRSAGGGALLMGGAHFLNRLIYWLGYPDEVSLSDDSLGGPEANAVANITYLKEAGQIRGIARFSKTADLSDGVVLETDQGMLILRDGLNEPLTFRPHEDRQVGMIIRSREANSPNGAQQSFLTGVDLFRRQLEDFVDACSQKRPPLVTPEQALSTLRLVEALYSQRNRQQVNCRVAACGPGGQETKGCLTG